MVIFLEKFKRVYKTDYFEKFEIVVFHVVK